jgi:CRP-like cAMP-binding protein
LVTDSALLPFLMKLERHVAIGSADREAILALPHQVERLHAGAYLFREGASAGSCCALLSGFACGHKIVGLGARQILSVYMRGDGIALENALLGTADHNIQALSLVEVAFIPAEGVQSLLESNPGAARALWIETLIDASIQREWTANVGQRNARARIAHVLCEIGLRQEASGLGARHHYELPLTQEQLGDATGLTAVHVNRVLQSLRAEGIVERDNRVITVRDWDELAQEGDFFETYLRPMSAAA